MKKLSLAILLATSCIFANSFADAKYTGPSDAKKTTVSDVKNMPDENGFHAFHIHDGSSCAPGKEGSHYNSTNQPHPQHAGDMPPLLANKGTAFSAFYTDRFYPEDIVGKVVVIHAMPDDFKSQPSGNPGSMIACGEIKEM